MPGISLQRGSSSSEEQIDRPENAGNNIFKAIGNYMTDEAAEIISNKPIKNADFIVVDLGNTIGKYMKDRETLSESNQPLLCLILDQINQFEIYQNIFQLMDPNSEITESHDQLHSPNKFGANQIIRPKKLEYNSIMNPIEADFNRRLDNTKVLI